MHDENWYQHEGLKRDGLVAPFIYPLIGQFGSVKMDLENVIDNHKLIHVVSPDFSHSIRWSMFLRAGTPGLGYIVCNH